MEINVFVLFHWGEQAYIKHMKKQQKELNALKKRHGKVWWLFETSFMIGCFPFFFFWGGV